MFKYILIYALIALCMNASSAQAGDLELGKPAPAATLETLDGHRISTESLHGKTVLLTFWATWCEPCQHELPLLSHYAATHEVQGLVVLSFSLDDNDGLDKVRTLAKQLSFPVGLLNQSNARGYGRIWRVPVSFVIDSKGLLRYNGWQAKQPAWNEERLKKIVGPLLTQTRQRQPMVAQSKNN